MSLLPVIESFPFDHICINICPASRFSCVLGCCCWCYQKGEPGTHADWCPKCELYLCNSCGTLPEFLDQPYLHPQHRLCFKTTESLCFICDSCLYACFSPCYYCQECDFKMCVKCISATASKRPLSWEKGPIFHYSHSHEFARCRLMDFYSFMWKCLVCELPLSGGCYGCVKCREFIHESCVNAPRVMEHPGHHPFHLLQLSGYNNPTDEKTYCKACEGGFRFPERLRFFCDKCDFNLHVQCAESLLRTLKTEVHPHGLFYLTAKHTTSEHVCEICCKVFLTQYEPSYHCVHCNSNFHFDCVPVPRTYKHRYHLHSLALVKSFVDDDSGEYYCDICEMRRDPKSHVYCCEICKFVGHIECVLSEESSSATVVESLSVTEESLLARKSEERNNNIFQHIHGHHPLRLLDTVSNIQGAYCDMCNQVMECPIYSCSQEDCDFQVHKKCAELSQELKHPLHPQHPPLSLFKPSGWSFICNICRAYSEGFYFSCRTCSFRIDVQCAFRYEMIHSNEVEDLRICSSDFVRVNLTGKFTPNRCLLCNHQISGMCYYGGFMGKFFHGSCLQWPEEVQEHPLQSIHRLCLFYATFISKDFLCGACGDRILGFGYECIEFCRFYLHLECGNSFGRFCKLEFHIHPLYYIHARPTKGYEPLPDFPHYCFHCKEKTDGSFYRCLTCKGEFHLKCLSLPRFFKHKWHLHRLTFRDSVDFGGPYCDISEEERDFRHPVYCCEECKSVVVHVECIVSEGDARHFGWGAPPPNKCCWWERDTKENVVKPKGPLSLREFYIGFK